MLRFDLLFPEHDLALPRCGWVCCEHLFEKKKCLLRFGLGFALADDTSFMEDKKKGNEANEE